MLQGIRNSMRCVLPLFQDAQLFKFLINRVQKNVTKNVMKLTTIYRGY